MMKMRMMKKKKKMLITKVARAKRWLRVCEEREEEEEERERVRESQRGRE